MSTHLSCLFIQILKKEYPCWKHSYPTAPSACSGEALPRILSAGLTMTIPLTLVSFTLAMVLAVAVALVQYAKVPVLSQLARFYIWVIRGTPLMLQIIVILPWPRPAGHDEPLALRLFGPSGGGGGGFRHQLRLLLL